MDLAKDSPGMCARGFDPLNDDSEVTDGSEVHYGSQRFINSTNGYEVGQVRKSKRSTPVDTGEAEAGHLNHETNV